MPRDKTEPCGPLLVVDDDEPFCALLVELLEDAGYTVMSAQSGRDVAELVARHDVKLVILDIELPVMSGYEVCRRLRQESSHPPILFISGERVEPLDRVAGLLLGGDDYLVKPFAFDELVARVRNLLGRQVMRATNGTLTRRELTVLQLLAQGLGHNAIAQTLVISRKTVGTHVEHIYEKLAVHNRTEALAEAYRRELLAPP